MTEVPDYLLERSRARRAALTGEGGGDAAPAAAASAAQDTPAAAAATPATPAAAAVPEVPAEPEPVPPYVEAYNARPKVPVWVVPVLLFLPIWAFFYVGTLERPAEEGGGLLEEGTEVYAACSACHGAAGGGGVGYAFTDGQITATFPDVASHVHWVVVGTAGLGPGTPYGSPEVGRVAGDLGVMPGFGEGYTSAPLTKEEMLAVILHERELGGSEFAEALATAAEELIESGELVLEGSWGEGDTVEMIAEELAPVVELAAEENPDLAPEGLALGE